MKNVRIWFKKDDECRYISHLDLNRCMLRALHKSRIPIWHTEGFNTHPYATFPLPLSLGFRGEKECMDVRLVDDYDFQNIKTNLNDCLPSGIRVYDVTEPVHKAKDIAYAEYIIKMSCDNMGSDKLFSIVDELFSKEEILVDKKTKKKILKTIDIKPSIIKVKYERNIGCVNINVTLPAGSVNNVNPTLLQSAINMYYGVDVYCDITKTNMLTEKMETFK